MEQIEELKEEVKQLRETNRRLNRREQKAIKALNLVLNHLWWYSQNFIDDISGAAHKYYSIEDVLKVFKESPPEHYITAVVRANKRLNIEIEKEKRNYSEILAENHHLRSLLKTAAREWPE